MSSQHFFPNNTEQRVQRVINIINQKGIDITGDYKQWIEIGAAIAKEFGERGRSYFHEVSRFYLGYTKSRTDRQYDACTKMRSFNIGTFFHIAKNYGVL
jgi:hypothetical protein